MWSEGRRGEKKYISDPVEESISLPIFAGYNSLLQI